MSKERPQLIRRSTSYLLLGHFPSSRSQESLFNTTQNNRNSFVTAQKQFILLIKDFTKRKEALASGTTELFLDQCGMVCVKKKSPLSVRKHTLQKTLSVLQDALPYERTRKLQHAIIELTEVLREQHPDCSEILDSIQDCVVIPVLSDAIKNRDFAKALEFEESSWKPKHIRKLLKPDNNLVHNAHYLSTVLVSKWMELEMPDACLRRDSAIIHLLKFWIQSFDSSTHEENVSDLTNERAALIYFSSYLRNIQAWPLPLLRVVRMMQIQIDLRQLQDTNTYPVMVHVIMLRHFVPLYHTHSTHKNKMDVARLILSYCIDVPLIARDEYREVCKLLRAL